MNKIQPSQEDSSPSELTFFAEFDSPSFHLMPVGKQNGFEAWLFTKSWLVFLVIIALFFLAVYASRLVPPTEETINYYYFRFGHYNPNDQKVYLQMIDTLNYLYSAFPDKVIDSRFLNYLYGLYFIVDDFTQKFTNIYLPGLVILTIEGFLLNALMKRIPKAFVELEKAGRLQENPTFQKSKWMPGSANEYALKMLQTLQSPWRYSFIFIILGVLAGILIVYDQFYLIELYFSGGYWPTTLYTITILIIFPLALGYYGGLALWLLFITSLYISFLSPVFKLNFAFQHLDKSAGFKQIGNLTVRMAFMTVLPSLIFSIWLATGIYDQGWQMWVDITRISIVFMLVVSLLVFIWPMLVIHREMKQALDNHRDQISAKIEAIQAKMSAMINSST